MNETNLTIERLKRLRRRGVRIALDDFGTGFSSLSYLRSFPFDKVKIDKSFITDIATSRQLRAIVRMIVELSKTLEMTPVTRLGFDGNNVLRNYI